MRNFEFKELTTMDMVELNKKDCFTNGDEKESLRVILEIVCPELIEIYENFKETIFENLSAEDQQTVVNHVQSIVERGIENMKFNIGVGE